MLAFMYFEKSKRMYAELSKVNYENSESILGLLPLIEVNQEERLLAPFVEVEKVVEDEEEEYIPQYILEINENIENEFEGIESEMKVVR